LVPFGSKSILFLQILFLPLSFSLSLSLSLSTSELFMNREYRKAMLVSVSLTFFQQATGQPTVVQYTADILQLSGVFADTKETLAAGILPAGIKLLATIASGTPTSNAERLKVISMS